MFGVCFRQVSNGLRRQKRTLINYINYIINKLSAGKLVGLAGRLVNTKCELTKKERTRTPV